MTDSINVFIVFYIQCHSIHFALTKWNILYFRKAARAVMILFPLFGMHFLLGLYRVPDYCGGLTLYAYFSKASDGLQGTFVAFLFCYLNGEVSTDDGFFIHRSTSFIIVNSFGVPGAPPSETFVWSICSSTRDQRWPRPTRR